MPPISPLTPFLEQHGVVVLDGGLATELERRGHDLDHPLWSARLLLEQPDAIREVHRSYMAAGADCLISATYQASIPALINEGLSEAEAKQLMRAAVTIACEVRDEHEAPLRPLVAASVGPYGALLADGAEYVGNYGVSRSTLRAYHEPRWEALGDSGADLIACETIPSFREAEVLLELLEQTPNLPAWVSFSCRDAARISDGTDLETCAALFDECESVVAVGINCTAPRYVSSLIEAARRGAPGKQIVIYPNSGEAYDGKHRRWVGESMPVDFGAMARDWLGLGATLIGGCCRTGPEHIAEIRNALISSSS